MQKFNLRFFNPSRVRGSIVKVSSLALALCLTISASCLAPAWSDPGNQLALPDAPPAPRAAVPLGQVSETLLVMPAGGAEDTDVKKALQDVHGTVVETIGEGPLTVYKIKCEPGKLAETEKKLGADKNFCAVQRDFIYKADVANAAPVNDPFFPQQWHLSAINVVKAWQLSLGGSNVLAVLDTGCNSGIADLAGKTYAGFDAVNRTEGQTDVMGHGTMVATTAAANTNNGVNTAAPARRAYIYPIRVADSQGGVSESAILQGIYRCGRLGIKIINISANASPPYSFANGAVHPALHVYLRWYHDQRGGLVFNSAGNDGRYDRASLLPYLIVVSAISPEYRLASFSTYGNPVWFTAPGVNIYCSHRTGQAVSVNGTSFSSPLAASVAALVWGANPGLRNTDVERILKQTCYTVPGTSWTPYYGYGMPNAEAAVRLATGR